MPCYIVDLIITSNSVFKQQKMMTRMAMPNFVSELPCVIYLWLFFYASSSLKALAFLIEKHQCLCDQLVNSVAVVGMGSILMWNKGNKFNSRSVLVVGFFFSFFFFCSLLLRILFCVCLELSFTRLTECLCVVLFILTVEVEKYESRVKG